MSCGLIAASVLLLEDRHRQAMAHGEPYRLWLSSTRTATFMPSASTALIACSTRSTVGQRLSAAVCWRDVDSEQDDAGVHCDFVGATADQGS